ncbi:MAG: multiheme c-type cytochrome [Verrucomicrobiales bacterium]
MLQPASFPVLSRVATALALVCAAGSAASVFGEDEAGGPDARSVDEIHRTYLETLRAENRYPSAVSCSQCHPDHFEEWSVSPHAYAMVSPVFNSMHAFITQRTGGTNGDFCMRCHTPVGMERQEDIYGSVLERSPAVVEGVTCVACHRVDGDFGTASGRLSLETGPLSDPVFGPSGNENLAAAIGDSDFGLITDEEERGKLVHRQAVESPAISRSAQCGSCHDVNSPTGLRLESAFTEFKHSPAAKEETSCQDCHMGVTPGAVVPNEDRHAEDGHDRNYAFGPAAKVRNSPRDRGEGKSTPPRKRTNHMFIGPDYSIVHPGIFPHSLAATELTYGARFRKILSEEGEDLLDYLKSLPDNEDGAAKRAAAEKEDLKVAAREAWKHALPDWLAFRWQEGWGTAAFEDELSEAERERRLAGAGFPWNDPENPASAALRRKSARLILSRQFNLLNRAHAERTRLLRRGLQLGVLEITKDDPRGLDFKIEVHNPMNGHAVPTGFDAERAMFLQIAVRDARGRTIFRSGDRDPNGDLRDLHSSYVHAGTPKTDHWLEASAWKEPAGLQRRKDDLFWRLDPHLFSLQSKFVARNLAGGERERIIPVNTSQDPAPFVRPPTTSQIHTGRGGGFRKQFRTIPPLGHRTATYRIDADQLTGERPYRIDIELISQMVPVNLVKKISSVGFDMNLSAREVANRVAFGHEVDGSGNRRGGAVTIWDRRLALAESSPGASADFTPTESEIRHVPLSEYPFPHTSEDELRARDAALGGFGETEDFMIQGLGPLLPEMWPGGVPHGLSLFPENARAVGDPEGEGDR